MADKPKLTPEQEDFLLLNWETMDLITMTRQLSGDPQADGRHILGRVIKEFLAAKGLKIKTTKFEAAGPIELTEDQKQFCQNNIDKMKTLEMARHLFGMPDLTPLSREFKAVYQYCNSIARNFVKPEEEPVEEEEYQTPKSIYKLLPRVNRAVPNPKNENEVLFPDIKKLSLQEEKTLRALLSNMNIPRFVYQANRYKKKVDRELFESSFIGMTWDKPDLKREEVEQYIGLASEIVQTAQIDRHIQMLDQQIEDALEGDDDGKKKLSMTMVELVNAAREKLDKSKERQRKLIENLVDSRADRLKKRIEANASILNLVDAWIEESTRQDMIKIAILQKKAEEIAVDKLADMNGVIALIAGLSRKDVLKSE